MLDRASPQWREQYIHFLRVAAESVLRRGLEAVLLIHERGDRSLAGSMQRGLGKSIPVFDFPPLLTKGVLGSCLGMIGSRFHALLGALSQGTPVLGTSWRHKYQHLFADYGRQSWLLDTPEQERIETWLNLLEDTEVRNDLRERLRSRASMHMAETRACWSELNESLA